MQVELYWERSMYRKLLLVVTIIPLLIGCSSSPKLAPTADVIVEDHRKENWDYVASDNGTVMAFIPLIPYYTNTERFFKNYDFSEEISKMTRKTRAFVAVVDKNNDLRRRADAPLELKVSVKYTRDVQVVTTYGLGFVGFVLHAIGFPSKYNKSSVEVDVECLHRESQKICYGYGSNTDIGANWIYGHGTSASARINAVVEKAFNEALQDCLENMEDAGFMTEPVRVIQK